MNRPRRLLVITIAAMMLAANANAEGANQFGVLQGSTLSCSVAAPSWTAGCFIEKRVATWGPVEFAFGVDAQATFTTNEYHLAPYAIIAVYMDGWSAWGEFALPSNAIPIIGRPDYVRVGFSLELK